MDGSTSQFVDQLLRRDADVVSISGWYGVWLPTTLDSSLASYGKRGDQSDLCVCLVVNILGCIVVTNTCNPFSDSRIRAGDFDVSLELCQSNAYLKKVFTSSIKGSFVLGSAFGILLSFSSLPMLQSHRT